MKARVRARSAGDVGYGVRVRGFRQGGEGEAVQTRGAGAGCGRGVQARGRSSQALAAGVHLTQHSCPGLNPKTTGRR